MSSKQTTPMKGKGTLKKGAVKGKDALIKFLGIDPKDKGLSKEDKDNYNGWIEWMKRQDDPEELTIKDFEAEEKLMDWAAGEEKTAEKNDADDLKNDDVADLTQEVDGNDVAHDPEAMQTAIDEAMRKLSKFYGAEQKADALKKKIVEVKGLAEALADTSMAQMPFKLTEYVNAAKALEAMCRGL